jgi:hypothetical protein
MPIFLTTLLSIFQSRALELENLALWICLSRLRQDWRSALAIVKPETVPAWHHAGFRLFWTWKVRQPTGTTCHFVKRKNTKSASYVCLKHRPVRFS